MKVLGKRILLDKPHFEEPTLELSPELKEEFERKEISKWKKLTVFQIGEDVTTANVGDLVYVSPMHLQSAEILDLEEGQKIMIREMDIALIW